MPRFRNVKYEKLDRDSGESLLEPHQRDAAVPASVLRSTTIRSIPWRVIALAIIPTLTLVLVVIFGGIILSRTWKPQLSQITITTAIPHDYCGRTPAEAKAAGCAFELNNFAWMHPDCYDAELDEDWTDGPLAGDLEFWENYNATGRRIPMDLVRTGEVEKVWVNTRQHRRHCLFVWEKYQRAAVDQRPMDNWTTDYKHTKHCIRLLRDVDNMFPDDMVSSYLTLKYPTCEFGPVQLAITDPTGH